MNIFYKGGDLVNESAGLSLPFLELMWVNMLGNICFVIPYHIPKIHLCTTNYIVLIEIVGDISYIVIHIISIRLTL